MNLVKKIGLAGVGPFKKQVFSIPSGITYVYGKNVITGNGNGVGKSLFFSSIAEMFYDPLIGTRQDKVKSGSKFISFQRGKSEVTVRSKFHGRSERLELLVDGAVQTGRKKGNTKENLAKWWPITENDYKTYGYLDSAVNHPLARGTTAERKSFFTSFFGLDRLDHERRIIKIELDKIKKVKAAYNELNATFLEVKKDMLSKQDREKLEEQQSTLDRKVRQLRSQYEKYQRVASLLEFENLAKDKIKLLKNILPDLSTFDDYFRDLKKRLTKAEESQDQLEEWQQYRKDLQRYEKAISGLDMTKSLGDLEKRSRLYQKAKMVLEDDAPSKPEKPKSVQKPEVEKDKLIVLSSNLKHQIDHAKKFGSGKCPTCGQDVKAEPLEKLESKRKKVVAQLQDWEVFEDAKSEQEQYESDLARYKEEAAKYEKAKQEAKKFKADHELYLQRRNLLKPSKVEKPKEVEDVEPLKEEYELLKFCQPHIEKIIELESVDRTVEFDVDKMNSTQEKLSVIRAKLEVHESVKVRASKMRDRLITLKDKMQEEQALQLLLEGYADKNVKRMIIEAISSHLMETVNYYAKFVFDNYKFEFIWGTQIQILVHRPKLGTTDVRKLSGAQSKLFTLILVLSLLKFVPSNKRLSMLIMDEPTASFHDKTIDQFHKLLPHLNQIIPSIVVITPKQTERMEGANEVTVVQNADGFSTIMRGHPDEIRLGNG